MARSQVLIVLPSAEEASSAAAVEETLRHFQIPTKRIFVKASAKSGKKSPEEKDIFCLIVRQHPHAVAWAESRYPHAPMLMIPRSFKNDTDALKALVEAARKPRKKARPTFALGKAGEVNAALFATAMLAVHQPGTRTRLLRYRQEQTQAVLKQPFLS